MRIRKAVLKKLSTDNGLFNMKSHIEIGKEYNVDIDSIQIRLFYNVERGIEFEAAIIFDISEGNFLPVEMLDIKGLD